MIETLVSLGSAISDGFVTFSLWLFYIAPTVFLGFRFVCHLVIVARVVTFFRDKEHYHSKVFGYLASLFAGFNLAEAIRIISDFNTYANFVQPWLTGIMFLVMMALIKSEGSVASIMKSKPPSQPTL